MTDPIGSSVIGSGFDNPSKRQQILDKLRDRLELILAENSYSSNLGQNVQEWDVTPLDPALEAARIEYRDTDETFAFETVGEWVERGKDVFNEKKEQLNQAIDASRQAYREAKKS